jgi:hypothetical protein
MDLVLVLAVVLAFLALPALAIGGTVDAIQVPADVWEAAGYRRANWVWQALGILVLPVGLLYSGAYFLRVRPRLTATERSRTLQRLRHAAPQLPVDRPADLPASSIKIRIPLAVNLITQLPLVILCASNAVLSTLSDNGNVTALLITWCVLLVVGTALDAWFGITLTTEAAVVQNLRRHRVAWSAVLAVIEEPRLGSRRVVLWTEGGRRIVLRAPVTVLPGIGRRRFERDLDTIFLWWITHRLMP